MQAAEDLAAAVGTARACACLGVPRASLYRRRGRASAPLPPTPRPAPPLQLSELERTEALALLYGERFVDASPYTLYATLLDEGRYLCSVRTLYRLLAEQGAGRERRNQLRHPAYAKPELLATAPNQLWSWDITKLKGPAKWTYFYLYVILDVFSRYVVGWMVATRECSTLAKQLIAETCTKHAINAAQLTLHADRGPSMTSKPLALLLADLGVTKTHSRPYVSDDNPFSEAQFKTLKYRPDFPQCFGSIADARAHCRAFFPWYNNTHRHSGIAFMTPEVVHYGRTAPVLATRAATLDAAFAANPNRFKRQRPTPQQPPTAVWINPPATPEAGQDEPSEQH
jgi:putative transposase